jgi:hypothetical protein
MREVTEFALLIPLLRDMALYFLRFRPGDGQYYQEIVRACRKARVDATFATTNYEMLIEYAMRFDGQPVGLGFGDDPPRAARVLKIHGSSNFVFTTPGATFKGISGSGTKHMIGGGRVDARWADEAEQRLRANPSLPPAMAVYAPGKQVLVGSFAVETLQARVAEAAATADKIYVIGLSVNPKSDPHIWDTLAKSPAPIAYVAPDRTEFDKWVSCYRVKNAAVVVPTFKEALPIILAEMRAA